MARTKAPIRPKVTKEQREEIANLIARKLERKSHCDEAVW